MEQTDQESTGELQARGRAWSPFRSDVVELLMGAEHVAIQPIYYGSNHTFLVTVDGGVAGTSLAVYKPSRGEYPLHDFPAGSLYKREVATWLVDSLLGWMIVPPTVTTQGPYGVGSLQLFIEAVAEAEVEVAELQRIALLDVIANNADRKGEHCLVSEGGKLWGIDHGLTFNAQPKLRTVLWHFAGRRIPARELRALRNLHAALGHRKIASAIQLEEMLSRSEWAALRQRVGRLVAEGSFPDPRYKSVPYRW
jgi:hypothetical protein